MRKNNYKGLRVVKKIIDFNQNRKKIWNAIDKTYINGDIIWINSFDTLKILGKRILRYKYVVHLLELVHETRFFYKFPYPKYDLEKYLKGAYRVVECEYNRACITQAWFDLELRPVVIPNKFFFKNKKFDRFKVPCEVEQQMQLLEGKKIVLYQGILGPERPIGMFAEAVSELGDDYVMVVMSNSKMDKKYNNLVEIGFISPPNHLYVTQRAHIGILNYQTNKTGFSGNDCLNSLYCAPNKIYEYSKFGLPMIGNDIPGLKYTIEYSGAGVCVQDMTKDNIKAAIIKVCDNYEIYKKNSFDFYDSVDIKKIIEKEILSEE